jgi:hypothetical protein
VNTADLVLLVLYGLTQLATIIHSDKTGPDKVAAIDNTVTSGLQLAASMSKGGQAATLNKIVPVVTTPDPATGQNMVQTLSQLFEGPVVSPNK